VWIGGKEMKEVQAGPKRTGEPTYLPFYLIDAFREKQAAGSFPAHLSQQSDRSKKSFFFFF
jgi:hypothetical protein